MPLEERPNLISAKSDELQSRAKSDEATKQAEIIQAMHKKRESGMFGPSTSSQVQDLFALAVSLQAGAQSSKEELQILIADVNGRMLESVKRLGDEIAALRSAVDEDRKNTSALVEKTATETLARSTSDLKQRSDELELSLSQKLAQLRDELKEDLSKQGATLSEVGSKLTLTRAELSSSVALLRVERKVLQAQIDAVFDDAMRKAEQTVLEQCTKAVTATVDDMLFNSEQEKKQLVARADAAEHKGHTLTKDLLGLSCQVTRNREDIENMLNMTTQKFNRELEELSSENRRRLGRLDERTDYLEVVTSEVENLPTRRIDWVIRDVSAQLASVASQKHRSLPPCWVSPPFEAAGVHDLQFELRFLSPAEIQANIEADSLANRGDCVLTLRAKPGLALVCRLYIGTAFRQFEHTFDEQLKPCCTNAMCYFRDQINQSDGSVTLSLEILESIRTVPRNAAPVPPETGTIQPDGSLMAHRYLNHRTLDIIQDQVDLIRSGMVRRIEWRIERASQMRKCFPENECICSTTFEAAGVQDLQLIFYPSGFKGAREGFCSFFLHCPAGAQLKCWLSVGKQRREARVSFDKPGYFGRTNFCRFDSCVDVSDDTALLVLEIEEAQQNIAESLSHQPKVSSVSTKSADRSSRDDVSVASTRPTSHQNSSPVLEKVDSSLCLQRVPGSKTLQETRQLPSIWTSVPKTDVYEAIDGFHSFNDIKSPRRPMTTGMTRNPLKTSGVAWKDPHPPPMSARQPRDNRRYDMYTQS